MADAAHLKILREGVAQWNAWRESNPGVRPDITETNLQRYPLAGANFAQTDLSATNLMNADLGTDPSGNQRLGNIGHFLREKICEFFAAEKMDYTLKYIDPSYTIRSMPANAWDSAFCLLLGYNAVHAGMSGRTNMFIGHSNNQFTHVPIPLVASKRKQIDPQGRMWEDVLACTGQPERM